MPTARSLTRLLLAAATLVYAWHLARNADTLLDDTFISLRYAKNLVEGQGLVFNPGERVEGFTNFTLVLFAALVIATGADPSLGTKLLSLAMAAWLLWLVSRLERYGPALGCAAGRANLAVVLLLPLEAFGYWSVSGMETMLFSALLAWCVLLALREQEAGRRRGSAWAFLLLALTRPEGLLLFGMCTAGLVVLERLESGSWSHLRRHAVNAALFVSAASALVLARLLYYGAPLPNTYYAKVTGGAGQLANGITYLKSFALAFPALAAAALLPLALWTWQARGAGPVPLPRLLLSVLALGHAAYVVSVGGDFMPFWRFFLPVMPLLCVLLAWLLASLEERHPEGRRLGVGLAALACAVHLALQIRSEQPYRAFVADRVTVVGQRVGEWLGRKLAPSEWIAVNTAGAIPYYSGLPSIDMLGLTDHAIARRPVFIISEGWAGHRRGWGQYVLDRRPRIVLFYNTAGSVEPFYLGDHELADLPLFRFFYRLKQEVLPPPHASAPLVKRFFGSPLEQDFAGEVLWGELGVKARFDAGWPRGLLLYDAPATVSYFEFEAQDEPLWEARHGADLDGLLERATERWSRALDPGFDPQARASVEKLCAEAYRRFQLGDLPGARRLLGTAAGRNSAARSPIVFQYLANISYAAGDVFGAVAAQKDALRLAPGSRLYRNNLKSLLAVPWKQVRGQRSNNRD